MHSLKAELLFSEAGLHSAEAELDASEARNKQLEHDYARLQEIKDKLQKALNLQKTRTCRLNVANKQLQKDNAKVQGAMQHHDTRASVGGDFVNDELQSSSALIQGDLRAVPDEEELEDYGFVDDQADGPDDYMADVRVFAFLLAFSVRRSEWKLLQGHWLLLMITLSSMFTFSCFTIVRGALDDLITTVIVSY